MASESLGAGRSRDEDVTFMRATLLQGHHNNSIESLLVDVVIMTNSREFSRLGFWEVIALHRAELQSSTVTKAQQNKEGRAGVGVLSTVLFTLLFCPRVYHAGHCVGVLSCWSRSVLSFSCVFHCVFCRCPRGRF